MFFYTFCFLKWPHLHVTIWWGLAGEPMQPLWWAVMYNRGNAEVLGYCGGSPRTQLHLTSGLCPLLCQDISPGRQQWLNCQSQMTAAAEIGIKPMISRKSILFWAIRFQNSGKIICETFTLRHMPIFGLQTWFSAIQDFQSLPLIYYIRGGKAQNSWTCVSWRW